MLPNSKPKLTKPEFDKLLLPYNINRARYPLIIIGIRGYYLNSMGKPGVNDRNIYDDAIFIDSPKVFAGFNANTDPSRYRPGIANIKPNTIFYAHRFDTHRGTSSSYPAICQRAGKVLVIRDGRGEDEGTGVNIHKGGIKSTGSEGCTTIPPEQWQEFYYLAAMEAQRLYGDDWQQHIIPYGVLEGVV